MSEANIPVSLLKHDVLNTNLKKLVWFSLLAKIDVGDTINTSAVSIAKDVGVSEKAVRNALKEFEDAGLIKTISPIFSPTSSPIKVRYKGRTIKLNGLATCGNLKTTQVRKKSDKKSDIKSDIPTAKISTNTLSFVDPQFAEVWQDWLEYRKRHNKTYANEKEAKKGYNRLLKLANNDPKQAADIVDQTIANGWQGLFPDKATNGTRQQARPALAVQANSYSELERAADAVLSNLAYNNPTKYD